MGKGIAMNKYIQTIILWTFVIVCSIFIIASGIVLLVLGKLGLMDI